MICSITTTSQFSLRIHVWGQRLSWFSIFRWGFALIILLLMCFHREGLASFLVCQESSYCLDQPPLYLLIFFKRILQNFAYFFWFKGETLTCQEWWKYLLCVACCLPGFLWACFLTLSASGQLEEGSHCNSHFFCEFLLLCSSFHWTWQSPCAGVCCPPPSAVAVFLPVH